MSTINLKINKKLKPFLTKHKKIKVAIGGRSGGKSIGFGDIFLLKMLSEKADIYCLREYQDSVADSVHRTFVSGIERNGYQGWTIQENRIISPGGAVTKYRGAARNPESIKSAQGYKYSWFEETAVASEKSLDLLIPTIIRTEGTECWFSANPRRSEDPFSQRFIIPFQSEILKNGYYEDDLHLIVVINWRDNPWHDPGTEMLRQRDYETMSRAKYDHIWEGAFSDTVEESIIEAEWFDSCIDAHKKLGFLPTGARIASHDPSDEGGSSKGYCLRHGSVIEDVQEMTTGDINEGGDWALSFAIQHNADSFTWDCDGMGIGLKRQVETALGSKRIITMMFRGSEAVDFPDSIYEPVAGSEMRDQKKNKDVCKNKRAQYYLALRDRVLATHRAVTTGAYTDPDKMISFSSDIKLLQKLRSELCAIPKKPNSNGKFELYRKDEMRTKFKIASPNLAESVMMSMRPPHQIFRNDKVIMPRPIGVIGGRR